MLEAEASFDLLKPQFLSVQRKDWRPSPAQQYPAAQTGAGATSKKGLGPQPVCDGLAETCLIGRGRWFVVCAQRGLWKKRASLVCQCINPSIAEKEGIPGLSWAK